MALATSQWEQIAIDSGYKNAASAKSTYSRLCGGSRSPTVKGGAPLSGGSKTHSKVTKRAGKIGSSSIKKPRGKKDTAAAAATSAEDDAAEKEQTEVKAEPEDEDEAEADAMMSGAL